MVTNGKTSIPLTWSSGFQLPEDWFGIGMEYPEIPVKTGSAYQTFSNLLSKLQITDDGPSVVRVGGASSQTAGIYQQGNTLGICSGIYDNGKPYGNGPGVDSPVINAKTPAGLALGEQLEHGLVALSAQPDVSLLLDGNYLDQYKGTRHPPACAPNTGNGISTRESLGRGLQPNLSTALDSQIVAANPNWAASKPSPFYGWELGNEPELTGGIKANGLSANFKSWATGSGLTAGPSALAGPAAANPVKLGKGNTCASSGPFVKAVAADASAVPGRLLTTGHTYGAAASSPSTSPNVLLKESSVDTPAAKVSCATKLAGAPYREDEFNSQSSGGIKNVDNSYASALWMTDALFSILNQPGPNRNTAVPGTGKSADLPSGVPVGVNIHVRDTPDVAAGKNQGNGNTANAPFTLPEEWQGGDNKVNNPANSGKLTPEPELYGMLMFVCTMDASSSWCNPSGGALKGGVSNFIPLTYDRVGGKGNRANNGAVKIWAARVSAPNGAHELRLLLINKNQAARRIKLKLAAASAARYTTLTNAGNVVSRGRTAEVNAQNMAFRGGAGSKPAQISANGQLTSGTVPFGKLKLSRGATTVGVAGYTEELVVARWK
ncbi:MAG: hypothetical protein J2O48_04895 [Solirubrobacterales bacterium]|nr:hypothetical protein [Solirubrobacterales bacterium]